MHASPLKGKGTPSLFSLPRVKDKERGAHDKAEAHAVIPFEFVAEIEHRENGKDQKGDDLLNGLELHGCELIGAEAIRGHLEAVFEEDDSSAN